jgi:hypothetical protein
MTVLDRKVLRLIRVKALEVALGATLDPKVMKSEQFLTMLSRGEPAAIHASGVRKALDDQKFAQYQKTLAAALKAVSPRLRPRTEARQA